MAIKCSYCGRDLNAIGQDNLADTNDYVICEDCAGMSKQPSNDDLMMYQIQSFQSNLNNIIANYSKLVEERYNNTMNRDHYMVYDMIDMMLSLNALMQEINRDPVDPGYMVEKLETIEKYVNTTKKYFESRIENGQK